MDTWNSSEVREGELAVEGSPGVTVVRMIGHELTMEVVRNPWLNPISLSVCQPWEGTPLTW